MTLLFIIINKTDTNKVNENETNDRTTTELDEIIIIPCRQVILYASLALDANFTYAKSIP